MNENLKNSVIICTRNRPEALKRCVSSLLNQSVKPKEIIIIDDASDKQLEIKELLDSSRLKKSLDSRIDIKYVRNKKREGVVRSRNLGIAAASGDIVSFIDDDGYAHRNWVKNVLGAYGGKNIAGAGGPVVEVGREIEIKESFKRLSYLTRYGDITHNYRVKKFSETKKFRRTNVRFLMGGNMSFRRSVLQKINGFNIQFKGNFYREETDACVRAAKMGKIVFEPSAVTYHNTAKDGGTRDVAHLDDFFYWYFRNTALFFCNNFGFRSAFRKIKGQLKKHVRQIRNGSVKVNRDYLLLSTTLKLTLAVFTGTIAGFFIGFLFDKPLKKLMYSHPQYATILTIALIGTSFYVVSQQHLDLAVQQLEKL